MGGMGTVFRNRVAFEPSTHFDFIFLHDYGGTQSLTNFKNINVRIVEEERLEDFLIYLTKKIRYDEIRITSLFGALEHIDHGVNSRLIYEFHTSSEKTIRKEISALNFALINEIWTPSKFLKRMLSLHLDVISQKKIRIVPNMVDLSVFTKTGPKLQIEDIGETTIPLIWVGRFDSGKNYKDFFRILSYLPDDYVGLLVVSLESDVRRLSETLYEARVNGVDDRVRFYLNFTQEEMAALYRFSIQRQGYFCSTSLSESFGYGVLEAALTGLPVAAYDIEALHEHVVNFEFGIQFVGNGDIANFVDLVKTADWNLEHRKNLNARALYERNQLDLTSSSF